MVEVQCETDFVARNEDFKAFAYQVALHVAATAPQLRLHRGDPRGGARGRTEGLRGEGARRRQARQRRREDRRRASSPSGRAKSRCSTRPHVNAEKHDGEDDRGAAPGAGGENRREHPDRPLRLLPRRRGISSRARDRLRRAALRAHPAEALRRGPDGQPRVRHRRRRGRADRQAGRGGPRPRGRGGDRGRRRQHLPRPRRRRRAAWTAPPATTWGCWRRCSTR